ncbi:MAG: SDR family NAD(P)-dependent oxidoreductase [Bacteroidota bacterium]
MEKIALITGATSGIGKATAEILAIHNFSLIISGRRKERLEEVKNEIQKVSEVKILILPLDVRQKKKVEEAIETLPDEWKNIDVLVNNAGLAVGLDHVDKGNIDDWERMIDTNLKGLLYVTRAVSPKMAALGRGHIINISSIAGREVYENGNVYCATKHAVDSLSRSMRIDLLENGIKVTNIAPGMVDTEFSKVRFKGDKERADKVYEGFTPLYAEDVAEAILFAVTRPSHVNINDLLIMPADQAAAAITKRDK